MFRRTSMAAITTSPGAFYINPSHSSSIPIPILSIPPQYAIQLLVELTKGKAIITTGVGQHQMWAAQFYKYKKPRQFLTSGGLGAMGFGLPAAIGAVVANPNAIVVDVDGDGSFMMNLQELATIKAENLPVKIVILTQ